MKMIFLIAALSLVSGCATSEKKKATILGRVEHHHYWYNDEATQSAATIEAKYELFY